MSLRIHGNPIGGLIRQSGDTVSQLPDGTWEAKVKYICRWASVLALAPRRNSSTHPDFPSMQCSGCDANRLKPGLICELYVTYRGTDPKLSVENLPGSTEEVVSNTSEAPIDTHPKFVSDLGGSKASPKNGAIFDADGKFTGWKATSKYAGTESYLYPSTIYRRTTPSRERPTSVADVGVIGDAPIGAGSGRNWLFSSRTWRRDGAVYTIVEEWMLSGRNGWDDTIYESL